MSKSVFDYINVLADKMLETMSELPEIQTIDQLIGNMSPEMRRKMSIPLGVEFQQGLVSLTAQELEAIRKLREIHLRLALYENKLKLVTKLASQDLDTVLEGVYQMQEVSKKWDAKLEGPWGDVAKFFQANKVGQLAQDVLQGTGINDSDAAGRVMRLMPGASEESNDQDESDDGGRPTRINVEILDDDFSPNGREPGRGRGQNSGR